MILFVNYVALCSKIIPLASLHPPASSSFLFRGCAITTTTPTTFLFSPRGRWTLASLFDWSSQSSFLHMTDAGKRYDTNNKHHKYQTEPDQISNRKASGTDRNSCKKETLCLSDVLRKESTCLCALSLSFYYNHTQEHLNCNHLRDNNYL